MSRRVRFGLCCFLFGAIAALSLWNVHDVSQRMLIRGQAVDSPAPRRPVGNRNKKLPEALRDVTFGRDMAKRQMLID
jgi:hypothetical protein